MKYLFIAFAILAAIFSYLWFTDKNMEYETQLIRDQWMIIIVALMVIDILLMVGAIIWSLF